MQPIIEAGFSSNSNPADAGYLANSSGAQLDKFTESANQYQISIGHPESVLNIDPGAIGSGIGGLFSTFGKEVLKTYDPKTNHWDLKGKWGRIVAFSLFDGAAGGYLQQAATAAYTPVDRSIFDGPHSPAILDFFTEQRPEAIGFLFGGVNSLFWRYVVIPRFRSVNCTPWLVLYF